MKHPLKSKTVIFNATLGATVATATIAPDVVPVLELSDQVQNGILAFSAWVGAVGNAILRFVTTGPIGFSEE